MLTVESFQNANYFSWNEQNKAGQTVFEWSVKTVLVCRTGLSDCQTSKVFIFDPNGFIQSYEKDITYFIPLSHSGTNPVLS